MINSRLFKNTKIAEIGLGTWQLGSADWGVVDEEIAFSILQTYYDAGGDFLDTADVYGMGISENMIGNFMQQTGTPFIVATKLGRRGDAPNGWPQNFTYDFMRKQVEDSLLHLGISQLFLEQLHCIPFETLKEQKVFDSLRQLQQEGLVKHWGVSVETTEEALFCIEQEGIASLQIIFNLFRQHLAEELFEKAAEKGVSLIVRVPLASGLLSGKFSEETVFSSSDHRNYNANGEAFNAGETFSGLPFSAGVALARKMGALMPDERLAAWAIRWILDHQQVTTVIPGASKVNQVLSNVSASALSPLPASLHAQLKQIYTQEVKPLIRGHY